MTDLCKLKLKGLDCASCATKIENALTKNGYHDANVNLITLEASATGDFNKIKSIILDVEPDLKITNGKVKTENEEDNKPNYNLIALLSALSIFIIAIILFYGFKSDNITVISLFFVSYFIAGWKVILSAFKNIIKGNLFDENFLMTIATLGAITIGEYPEAAGVMIFFMIGEYFQEKALNKSRNRIKSLLKLKSEFANLEINGNIKIVKPETLKIGDIIIIKPGERVPVDGIIISGQSSFDTSALTGESLPKTKKAGEDLLSGTINLSNLIKIKVTKVLSESTISRILQLVENATSKKAKTEKFITKFAKYYTPVVVISAIAVAILPPLLSTEPFSMWISRALVLLVISCPCALVLSIPLGYFGGIGKSAKNGILIKGSNFLDILANVSIIAFDKTGTLTKGVFKVTEIVPIEGITNTKLLKYAAIAETNSNHPIANAIKKEFNEKVEKNLIIDAKELPGLGVVVNTNDSEIIAGNDKLLHKFNITHNNCNVKGTVIHISLNKKYVGYIVISDEIKKETKSAILQLAHIGIKKSVMVTGDNKNVAKEIGNKAGITDIFAELMPEDKVNVINKLKQEHQNKKQIVGFVGDGINDAPVLATADLGIAMGGLGSDIAIETADIVIMDDNLEKISKGIKIARFTKKIVWQNIVIAICVKFVFIGLGIIGEASMWEAVFADVGMALFAVFNSMRILK